jgi:hypothetical protein
VKKKEEVSFFKRKDVLVVGFFVLVLSIGLFMEKVNEPLVKEKPAFLAPPKEGPISKTLEENISTDQVTIEEIISI